MHPFNRIDITPALMMSCRCDLFNEMAATAEFDNLTRT